MLTPAAGRIRLAPSLAERNIPHGLPKADTRERSCLVVPSLIRLLTRNEGERRRSPRYLVPEEEPLVVGLVVIGSGGGTLTGRVKDISETGLSILLPEGEACGGLSKPGGVLGALLSLPSGVVRLRAEVAHYSAPRGGSGGQLVGVCISEISAGDRDRLAAYIAERS